MIDNESHLHATPVHTEELGSIKEGAILKDKRGPSLDLNCALFMYLVVSFTFVLCLCILWFIFCVKRSPDPASVPNLITLLHIVRYLNARLV